MEPTMQCLNVIGYSCDITSEWFWPCWWGAWNQVMVILMRLNHHWPWDFWGELNFLQTLLEDAWKFTADDGKTPPKHMFSYIVVHRQTPRLQRFSCGSWSADRTCFCHAFLMTGSNLSRLTKGSSPGEKVTWIGLDRPGEAWRGLLGCSSHGS